MLLQEGNLTQGHISFGKKLNKMSTVSIILIALMIEYFFDDLKKYRKNDILVNGYNYFQKKLDTGKYSKNTNICIAFAIIVLIISMSIASIADYISKIIFFIVSLVFLLFSLRTNQFNRDMEELKIKLEFDKDSIEKNILFSLCPNLRQTRAKTNLNELVIKKSFFNSIRNTFTIIFVFILLGAPAALTYKVLDIMIYSDNFKLNIQTKNELKKYIYFIDYIPIRLTSYCLSMVSNYDRVMERINNLELSNNAYLSNIEYINQTGESVYDNSKSESDQIIQIQNILSRTLIAWLSLIFLLGITGIFI